MELENKYLLVKKECEELREALHKIKNEEGSVDQYSLDFVDELTDAKFIDYMRYVLSRLAYDNVDVLNTNDDLTAGPNDGLYNQEESFVIYTRQGQKYAYYVRLIEEVDGRNIGFDLINSENIEYITAEEVKEINDLVGISIVESSADNIEIAKGNSKIHNICGDNIRAVYMEN